MNSVDHKLLLYELKLELLEYDELELLLYISNESLNIEKNLISKFCYERIG
jgi:hypothetical protein